MSELIAHAQKCLSSWRKLFAESTAMRIAEPTLDIKGMICMVDGLLVEIERLRSLGTEAEPAAWMVTLPGRDFSYFTRDYDKAKFRHGEEPGSEILPLYKSFSITGEEQDAIRWSVVCAECEGIDSERESGDSYFSRSCFKRATTLRGLLKRAGFLESNK